ncbi:MAG: glycosyltransferase [Deltaproteobacteria bacterium]|nr:glycosyltransferase [Deltaproteobacteria bacterium]
MKAENLNIAMLSIHSDPFGQPGTLDTGGMSVYISELARELGGRGHRVDIYTRLHNGDHQPVIQRGENVRLIHLDITDNGNLSKLTLYPYLSKFFQSLETYRRRANLAYDVIHSHYWLSGRLGTWAQNDWKRPHVVTFHTLGESKNRAAGNTREPELRIANEKKLVQTCHRIVVPTKRESDSLVRFYGAPEEKIGVVPCGVNLELFRPEKKRLARQRLEFDPDEIILLYVGRFEALKGLDILLAAMTYLKSSDRFRLVIVGGDGEDHPAHQSLKQKTRALRISEKCVFTGPIEQKKLPPYYNSADVLVIPSRYESFGLVGLEALACGRPVVSTPVGAMDHLLRDVRAVRVVGNSSPESLAGEIQSLIADRSLPSSAEIRASVKGYSWSRVAGAILREYQEAMDQHASEKNILTHAQASG